MKAEMEKAKQDLNRKRPCKKSSDTTELRRVAIRAKEAGVDDRTLREMARLIKTACSEMRLNQCVLQCREIECADESHVGLRKRLDKMIQECALAGGYDSLVRYVRVFERRVFERRVFEREAREFQSSRFKTHIVVKSTRTTTHFVAKSTRTTTHSIPYNHSNTTTIEHRYKMLPCCQPRYVSRLNFKVRRRIRNLKRVS